MAGIMCAIGASRPKHHELFEKIIPHFASLWKEIGVFLEISHEELRVIEKDDSGKCRECCNKMFCLWLDTTPTASWSMLAEAVGSAMKTKCK